MTQLKHNNWNDHTWIPTKFHPIKNDFFHGIYADCTCKCGMKTFRPLGLSELQRADMVNDYQVKMGFSQRLRVAISKGKETEFWQEQWKTKGKVDTTIKIEEIFCGTCEDCYNHDPFDGEETFWYPILQKKPDKCLCGFGFTDEERIEKNYAHVVGRKQRCPKFKFSGYLDD